jgi:hypothetical protein
MLIVVLVVVIEAVAAAILLVIVVVVVVVAMAEVMLVFRDTQVLKPWPYAVTGNFSRDYQLFP